MTGVNLFAADTAKIVVGVGQLFAAVKVDTLHPFRVDAGTVAVAVQSFLHSVDGNGGAGFVSGAVVRQLHIGLFHTAVDGCPGGGDGLENVSVSIISIPCANVVGKVFFQSQLAALVIHILEHMAANGLFGDLTVAVVFQSGSAAIAVDLAG